MEGERLPPDQSDEAVRRAAESLAELVRPLMRHRHGVLVHVHDVFLPFDYDRSWVVDHLLFWAEQYLLQAFLMFNSEFEVVFANSDVETCFPEQFRATFPKSPWWGGGSFWMRRKLQECSGRRAFA